MNINPSQQGKPYARIIAKAWADEEFKARLMREPAAVLREHGIEVPDGTEVRVLEDTSKVVYFVLPARPQEELSEEELAKVAGGFELCSGQHADHCWA